MPPQLSGQVERYMGVVVSASASVGPASTISYTINVNLPTGMRQMTNVRPFGNRWPDIIDILAAPPGTIVDVYDLGGVLQFQFVEYPSIEECL